MLVPFFPFRRKNRTKPETYPVFEPDTLPLTPIPRAEDMVRRHFYNERGFQVYASFFACWNGYVTAGHVMSECGDRLPPFANGPVVSWPGGLDAAILGCQLPRECPPDPVVGRGVICVGYPAGSAYKAQRRAKTYLQRPGTKDSWIAHILDPDEPVVTGMSGGAVIDEATGKPIGIVITRNSPADLNNDRDPDESFDFISLASLWRAVRDAELSV